MAFRAGTVTKFYLGNTAGALQDVSTYADSTSVPFTTAVLVTTTFGSDSETSIPGLKGGDAISVSGPFDTTMLAQLGSLWTAGSITPFLYGPGGSVAGQTRQAGSCYVTNVTPSSQVGGKVVYSASLQITGAVSTSTF